MIIKGYQDPALEGVNITFSCHGGLIGPNSATCTGNGEWEPDPREVNCTRLGVITGLVTSGASILRKMPYLSQKFLILLFIYHI